MGRSCFNIISCGCINQSVDKDEVDVSSQIKGPHKSGWSLKKTSPKREAPSNTVVNENLSSTDNKEIREPINISSEPHINSNISEKTLDNILTKDIPNLATKVVCEENDIKCERISEESESKSKSESAVLVIQAAVRRFLAERQLVRHKNAVKLQAAVRGHLVRNHAVGTLRCVQAIVKMQTLVRARREKGVQNMGSVNSNPTHVSVEKLLSNGLARQLLESTPKTKQINIKCDPLKSDSAWNWLERWMSVSAPETLQPHTDQDNVVNKTEDEVKTVISKTIPENSLSNTEPKLITENPVSKNEDKSIPENLVSETKPETVPENLVSETEPESVPQNPVSETEPKPIPQNPISKTEPEPIPENPILETEPELVHENLISETEPEPVHENLISETEPEPVSDNIVSETEAKPIPENPILGTEPKPIPENPKSETEPEPTPGNSISEIEPEPIPENPVSETKPEPMPGNPLSETEPEPIPENPVLEFKPEPMPDNPTSETEPEPIPENPVSETKPEPMTANTVSETEPEPMPENAVSETEAKHASKQTGSRKASNPAFIAAQSKFEKLTSFKVNPLKSPGSSDQDDVPDSGSGSIPDIGSSDPLKPATSSDQVDLAGSGSVEPCEYSVSPGSQVAQTGGSECGTELSITSTLHSSGPFEIENTKFEEADTNINCDDNNNNNSNDNKSNSSSANNNNNNNNNIGVATPEQQDDQNPDIIEPEPEPESSHITNLESQDTPSSQLSTASKKTRTYKKVSSETRKSWSNSKKTSPVSPSVEQLPKESKPGKRRNLFGSPKPDHVDGEPVVPGYLQPTESARAKVVANSSPRSSPDLKKRQSLPGAINGRHGSPRIQRSMSQATKGDGNQDGK